MTHNERREQVLNSLYRLFTIMNNSIKGNGDGIEKEIADRYRVSYISELSCGTLIKEYERLMGI